MINQIRLLFGRLGRGDSDREKWRWANESGEGLKSDTLGLGDSEKLSDGGSDGDSVLCVA